MSSLPPIRTAEDFHRLKNKWHTDLKVLIPKGLQQGLSTEQIFDEVAVLKADFLAVLTDPENPVAIAEGRKDMLSKPPYINNPETNPRHPAVAIVKAQTEGLNRIFGKTWPSPHVVVVEGYRSQTGRIAAYSRMGDFIAIDSGFANQSPTGMRGVIGHELAHRYQRSKEALMVLQITDEKFQTPQMLNKLRQLEAEADFYGAVITSPEIAKDDFLFQLSDQVLTQYVHERLQGKTVQESVERYYKLPSATQSSIQQAFRNLTPIEKNKFIERVHLDDTPEEKATHPSDKNRLAFLDYLKANPQLLTCRNVTFDGSANIVSAQECGPSRTTIRVPSRKVEAQYK